MCSWNIFSKCTLKKKHVQIKRLELLLSNDNSFTICYIGGIITQNKKSSYSQNFEYYLYGTSCHQIQKIFRYKTSRIFLKITFYEIRVIRDSHEYLFFFVFHLLRSSLCFFYCVLLYIDHVPYCFINIVLNCLVNRVSEPKPFFKFSRYKF